MSSTSAAVHLQLLLPWKREGNCQVTTGDDVAYAVVAATKKGRENVGGVRRKRVVPTSSSMDVNSVQCPDCLPKDDMRSSLPKDTPVRSSRSTGVMIIV